ncbi:MAG: glycosyltransferase family 4 protein [Planctomycetes bacterium]|nr:glycosyltransferase family 4 protein [Planctomycetota bacterium]
MTTEPRHVLMIAAAFPPAGGSGVQRTLKFTKYLHQFGWQPIVWTVDQIDGLPTDESLCLDIPPTVEVHRQRHQSDPFGAGYVLRRLQQSGGLATRLAKAAEWRLEKWHRQRTWPDEFAKWVDTSVAPLEALIHKRNIRAIYSTYSPAANHLLALQLKRRTGLPWLADFRDLWTDDLRYNESNPRKHAANLKLEQSVLEEADAVVGVSPSQTRVLASHTPQQASKFHTITNGFDPADFKKRTRHDRNLDRLFTLAFVGRFDRHRADDDLFVALREFVDGLGERRDRFVFRIVGEFDSRTAQKLENAKIPFAATGYVSHQAAVAEMRSADALLLTTDRGGPNADTVICGKIFEYLASGTPILSVGPEGWEGERLIRSQQAGPTVAWVPQRIASALSEIFGAWQKGNPMHGAQAQNVKRFSRVHLTEQLVEVLDGITDCHVEATSHEHRSIAELAQS